MAFALVIGAAALLGLASRGSWLRSHDASVEAATAAHARTNWRHLLAIAIGGVAVWWLPVGVLALALGGGHVLVDCGVYFGKLAVLSFGSAYAVLGYVANDAVHHFAWVTPAELLDGLGLADFDRLTETRWGALRVHQPDITTLDGVAATIAITALVALHRQAGMKWMDPPLPISQLQGSPGPLARHRWNVAVNLYGSVLVTGGE